MSATPSTISVTRYVLIAIALVAVAVLFWALADVLVIAFGAIVFATMLQACIDPLERATGLRRRWCVAIVVLTLLALAATLGWLFGRQATNEFVQMREQLPAAFSKFRDWLSNSAAGRVAIDSFEQIDLQKTLAQAGLALGAVVSGVGTLLVVLFAGVYFASDPQSYRHGALRLLPPARRPQVGRALDDAGTALHKWLVAQLIVMAAVGLTTGLGLAILGVPLSLSLGLLAGLCEFVPVFGPIAAAVPGVLLAFAKGPETALHVLLLYIVVQQLESNLLTPLMQRWAVDLPPVIALLSIVAGGLLFGPMGVIFATPLAVVVLAMVQHLYVEDTLENGGERHSRAPRAARAGRR